MESLKNDMSVSSKGCKLEGLHLRAACRKLLVEVLCLFGSVGFNCLAFDLLQAYVPPRRFKSPYLGFLKC